MTKDEREAELAWEIFHSLGDGENIARLENCMTRLRLELKNPEAESLAAIPSIEGVLGIHTSGTEYQIILGPSRAAAIASRVKALWEAEKPPVDGGSAAEEKPQIGDGEELHEKLRRKNATPVKLFFRRIASIFLPLIPGFIACGLITGVLSTLGKYDPALTASPIYQLAALAGSTVFFGMHLLVGRNASEIFGGTPVLGAMLGAYLSLPALGNITLGGEALVPGRGGIIAVLLAGILSALLEKRVRRLVPEALSLFLTPLITFLLMAVLAIAIIQPIGGVLSDAIGAAATGLVEGGGAAAGAFLGGIWLPIVMLGIHQAFTPIHADLLARYGYTILLPILAMAGAGQVGASLAIYTRTKNARLKKIIASALPVGFLGVGEPLIYGVTLPLGRPFLAACIGGACGGAVNAFFAVGATTFGISGLPLALATTNIPAYCIGLVTAYLAGFIATRFIGFDDPVDE